MISCFFQEYSTYLEEILFDLDIYNAQNSKRTKRITVTHKKETVGMISNQRYLFNFRFTYFGCSINNKPEGLGIQFYEYGNIFIGNFKNGKLNGFGKRISKNGNQFIGKFFRGKEDSKGYSYKQNYKKWNLFNLGKFLNSIRSNKTIP